MCSAASRPQEYVSCLIHSMLADVCVCVFVYVYSAASRPEEYVAWLTKMQQGQRSD